MYSYCIFLINSDSRRLYIHESDVKILKDETDATAMTDCNNCFL